MTNKKGLLTIFVLLLAAVAIAQPGGGGDPGHGQPVPIPGIEFLLIGGGILGLRHIRRNISGKR